MSKWVFSVLLLILMSFTFVLSRGYPDNNEDNPGINSAAITETQEAQNTSETTKITTENTTTDMGIENDTVGMNMDLLATTEDESLVQSSEATEGQTAAMLLGPLIVDEAESETTPSSTLDLSPDVELSNATINSTTVPTSTNTTGIENSTTTSIPTNREKTISTGIPTNTEDSISTRIPTSTENDVSTGIPTSTEKSIPTSTEKSIPTSTEKSIPTSTEKSIPTSTEKSIPSTESIFFTSIPTSTSGNTATSTTISMATSSSSSAATTTTTTFSTTTTSSVLTASTTTARNNRYGKEGGSESCVDFDVRVCLRNDCDWRKSECVTRREQAFPAALPASAEEAWELFKSMWSNPPKSGPPYLWQAFVGTSAVLGVTVALSLIVTGTVSCIKKLVSLMCRCCCKRQDAEGNKKRRIVLIMPTGRKVPLNDYVIDCTDGPPRTRRVPRDTNTLFKNFYNASGVPRNRNDCGPLALVKEDLECPVPRAAIAGPSWAYNGEIDDDDISSLVTATICRKSKAPSSKFGSTVMVRTFSESEGSSDNGSGCNEDSGSSLPPPPSDIDMYAVPNPIAHDNAEDDGWSEAVAPPSDVEGTCSNATANDTPTVLMAVDETDNKSEGSKNSNNGIYEVPRNISLVRENFRMNNAQKLQDFQMKLTKATPPTVPLKATGIKKVEKQNSGEDDVEESTV